MAKINKLPEGLQLILEPGEILHLPINHGSDFTDALRNAGWTLLHKHARQLVKDQVFLYADVAVIDGAFSIMFFQTVPPPPHGVEGP